MSTAHLVKMVNQISDNMSLMEGAAETPNAVRLHLQKFWAPVMLDEIKKHARGGGDGLTRVSLAAIALLD